jgi:FkbM family methyltransferase
MIKGVKNLIYILRRRGLFIALTKNTNTLEGLLFRLRRDGLKIDNIFDIGAYKGVWTNTVRRIYKNAQFELFEPNDVHNHDLSRTGQRFHNVVLSNKIKTIEFYSLGTTGDSYYKEENPIFDDSSVKLITTTTLDDLMGNRDLNLRQPDLIKVDTQGSEIDILLGGEGVVSNAKIVILECPIVNYNQGAPSISEYITYMQRIDFVPIWVSEVHVLLDVFIQIDIAFMSRKCFKDTYARDPNWR